MISVVFEFYYILIAFILILTNSWLFFLKNNFFFIRLKPYFFDKLKKQNILKKLNFRVFLRFSYILYWLFFVNLYFIKGVESSFFWNHFFVTNFNMYIIVYIYMFNLIIFTLLLFYGKSPINVSVEYIFAIININIIILLLFLVNNLYSLIFILELISISIFYKFTVSKFWLNNKTNKLNIKTRTKLTKILPSYYLNMLFFQYWSTFFSSVLILYSLISINLLYGCTDWYFMNFLFKINSNLLYFEKKEFFLIFIPLFFGVIIKLGMTPIHLYKIEVYKGLPFLSIFLYTTYYFLVYFIFFYLFFYLFLFSYSTITWIFLFILLTSGLLYFLSILFDGILIKSFFAFSTIINSLNFLIIIVINI